MNTPISKRRLLNLVHQQLEQAKEMNGSKHPDTIEEEENVSKEVGALMIWFINSFYNVATTHIPYNGFFCRQTTRIARALSERRRVQIEVAGRDYQQKETA